MAKTIRNRTCSHRGKRMSHMSMVKNCRCKCKICIKNRRSRKMRGG